MSPPRPRRSLPVALAAVGAAVLATPALAAEDDVVLISRATGPAGEPADATSVESSISLDGRFVAFSSDAGNISGGTLGFRNIFVRDLVAGTTTLVSRASGAAGAPADDGSASPSISADGRFVAFDSDADNLSPDANAAFDNVFVRDLLTSTTTLVSRASGPGGVGADGSSTDPDISDHGRYVVFESHGNNLSSADDNNFFNVFVRDLVTNTTRLISRTPGPGGPGGNADSTRPAISGDGSRIAFQSDADNLSNQDDDSARNVFVRERATGANTLVSRASGVAGAPADSGSDTPDISPSGRFVGFRSSAANLSGDDKPVSDIFLRDLDEATTELASRASGPGGEGGDSDSFNPAVSDNARVAFESSADNLTADDDDAVLGNVYVRDAPGGTTGLVSRAGGPTGAAANGTSSFTAWGQSGDGRYVVFQSEATNLVPGTVPGVRNVFRRDVLGDQPIATPACKALPLPASPPAKKNVTFTLSAQQLLINQRIGQAAIRRLNAVQARLDGGLAARDLCGYSVGPAQLGAGITSAGAGASLAPVARADPTPIVDPGRKGTGDPVTLSARQLLINQRVYQAAIRRADGIEARLAAGLSGGDVRNGQVTQGKLYDRLQILAKVSAPEPPASKTVIPGRKQPGSPGDVTLSVTQLTINQRIAQAGVRDANALVRRLETGLSGADLRPGTLTAADLG
jgi:Tol biopolymer transport system component